MSSLKTAITAFAGTSIWLSSAAHGYVWPDATIDKLEGLLYEQLSVSPEGFAPLVQDCFGFAGTTTGRNIGAEWVRNAYHDMATADVEAGTGGIDASIFFEMDRPENAGQAFSETLGSIVGFLTTRSSVADLVAMAAIQALGACSNGTLTVPFRAGRIDATGPGPSGVPEPQQDLATHTAKFVKQGFNTSEMIALVACGHSLGGVHGVDFPTIVPPGSEPNPDDTTTFDSTSGIFENKVASEFVSNTTKNALVVGANETTRSDFRIFGADGGDMIRRMAESNEFYISTCSSLMERMVNTVPRAVKLTDPIPPIPVKPKQIAMDVEADGNFTVSGLIRFEDSVLPTGTAQVILHFTPAEGTTATGPITATASTAPGQTGGCMYPNCASFTYYSFNLKTPVVVSSFTIEMIDPATGNSKTFDNGGTGGYPLESTLVPSFSRSCFDELTIFPNGTTSTLTFSTFSPTPVGNSTVITVVGPTTTVSLPVVTSISTIIFNSDAIAATPPTSITGGSIITASSPTASDNATATVTTVTVSPTVSGEIFAEQFRITIAVLNADQFDDVSAVFTERTPRGALMPTGFETTTISMTKGARIEGTGYTLFNVTYPPAPDQKGFFPSLHPYDIVATGPGGKVVSAFNDFSFGGLCSSSGGL